MKYPPFVAEMALPINRPKLQFGIYSGYAIAAGFSLLAAAAAMLDLAAWRWAFLYLVLAKFITNTFAWWCLHRRVFVLESQGLNTYADLILMTAAIYFTGGPVSPLLPIYVINIVVLALLSNLGVTIMFAIFTVLFYSIMVTLIAVGVLPPTEIVGSQAGIPSPGFVATAIAYCAFVVGVPTVFTTATLRLLRGKERTLEQRTAQLIEAGTQRSQFVASLTHELRTPIHGVAGLSALLEQGVYGPINDKQRDVCEKIGRSATTLLALVDDLLNLARAEAGKLDVRPDVVDVAGLVDNVATSVSWMMSAKQQELVVTAPRGYSLHSDARWLAHIMVNLIANAAKFTPVGGRIEVSATSTGDACIFKVRDNGIGISDKDQLTIFEPFRQVDGGDARGYGGVGLGLALVARLSSLLGAKVSLESALGRGTTFTIVVPPMPKPDPVEVVSLPLVES
jgi:signal transduction histidine kinase